MTTIITYAKMDTVLALDAALSLIVSRMDDFRDTNDLSEGFDILNNVFGHLIDRMLEICPNY